MYTRTRAISGLLTAGLLVMLLAGRAMSANTQPTITTLTPNTTLAGSADFLLTVDGTNFTSTSQIYFGRTALTTTFVSTTELTATVPSTSVALPHLVGVFVYNGPGTWWPSFPSLFTVTPADPPILTSISPTTVVADSGAFPLTVTGSNFLSTAVILFGRTALTTTFVSATELTATVPGNLIDHAGAVPVVVTNGPVNGASGPVWLPVTPPTAQVTYHIPYRGTASSADIDMVYRLAPGAALDLTQPVTITLENPATTTTAAVPVYSLGPVTLTSQTFTPFFGKGTPVTFYEYTAAGVHLRVVPKDTNEYTVNLDADDVDLSAVTLTAPVDITLVIGGQTFTDEVTPETGR